MDPILPCYLFQVTAQRGDEESSFSITEFNNRRGSRPNREPDDGSSFQVTGSGDRGSGSSGGRLTGSGGRLPDYVRVEVEVQRLDNPRGLLSNGKSCDITKKCDTRISAFMDL